MKNITSKRVLPLTVPKMGRHMHDWHFFSSGRGTETLRCDSCGVLSRREV